MQQKTVFWEIIFFSLAALLIFVTSSVTYAGPALYSLRNGYIVVLKDDIENPEAAATDIKQIYNI